MCVCIYVYVYTSLSRQLEDEHCIQEADGPNSACRTVEAEDGVIGMHTFLCCSACPWQSVNLGIGIRISSARPGGSLFYMQLETP